MRSLGWKAGFHSVDWQYRVDREGFGVARRRRAYDASVNEKVVIALGFSATRSPCRWCDVGP